MPNAISGMPQSLRRRQVSSDGMFAARQGFLLLASQSANLTIGAQERSFNKCSCSLGLGIGRDRNVTVTDLPEPKNIVSAPKSERYGRA